MLSSSRLLQRLAPTLLSVAAAAGGRQQALGGAVALALTSSPSSSLASSSLRHFSAIKAPPGGTSEDASVPVADDDTHADFRPSYAPPATADSVRSSIERDVATHDVFVYMKVTLEIFSFSSFFLLDLDPPSPPLST